MLESVVNNLINRNTHFLTVNLSYRLVIDLIDSFFLKIYLGNDMSRMAFHRTIDILGIYLDSAVGILNQHICAGIRIKLAVHSNSSGCGCRITKLCSAHYVNAAVSKGHIDCGGETFFVIGAVLDENRIVTVTVDDAHTLFNVYYVHCRAGREISHNAGMDNSITGYSSNDEVMI